MKVSHKLALLPAAALLGIMLIAAVLLRNTGVVYESANYGNAHAVPGLLVLNKLKSHFLDTRVLIWQHVATHDAALMDAIEKNVAAHRAAEEEALKEYEPYVFDARDRELLAADRAAVEAYDGVRAKSFDMSRAGKKAELADWLIAEKPRLAKLGDALSQHIEYAASLAHAAGDAAARARQSALRFGILVALVTVGAVGALGWVIFRQLTRQFGGEPAEVAVVANKVAAGDFSSTIALRPDDTGSLFATVSRMQRSLQERANRDRAQAEEEQRRFEMEREAATENARIRMALDGVSVGVMLADRDGRIIYANQFCHALFRDQAGEIRKQLPSFDPDRIIGNSFDLFHARPSHQHRLLADLTKPHTADVQVGRTTLRIIVNPVMDAAGSRLGSVVQWIDRTQERRVEDEVKAVVSKAVEGDLTVRVSQEGKDGFFKVLASGMNELLASIAEVIRSMSVAAGEVRTGADEISRGNLDLSQRTEEQASSLEQTAASMEQMTAMVKSNADNAAQANQLASAAREQAERGGKVVGSAVAAMNEINAASKKIADIIGVIDDIAFQTNLLALNAAVEAARAGEQGRGFAVVASEVRNLASRSAGAAKEIKGLIQDSVNKVSDGARLVDESGKVLGEIVTGVKKVTDVMAEIAASSMEQASGIEQVNKAVTSMDGVTQQNAALVEQASAAAHTLTDQAANLTQLIARYRLDAGAAAPVSGAAPARTAPPARPAASAGERRAANRPFSARS